MLHHNMSQETTLDSESLKSIPRWIKVLLDFTDSIQIVFFVLVDYFALHQTLILLNCLQALPLNLIKIVFVVLLVIIIFNP